VIPRCRVGPNVNGQSNGRLEEEDNGHKNEKSPQMIAEEARQRNFLAPVSRLPPERMLLVFTHLRDICVINRFKRRDWMNVTRVLHSWREITLCAPNLWTNIRISKGTNRWASEMLYRSQQSPLSAHVDYEGLSRHPRELYADTDAVLTTLEENVGRCSELSLCNVQAESFSKFFPPNHDASHLHSLKVTSNHFLVKIAKKRVILSDQTLRASALRRLTLFMVELDLNSSFLRGLTHLKFTFGLFRPSDAQNFLKILPDMVNLESLDVDGTIPFMLVTPCQSSITGSGKIHVPTLKELRIDAPMENIATLLSMLELTSELNLCLITRLNDLDAHPLDSFDQCVEVLKLLSAIFAPKATPSLAWTPSSSNTTPPPPRSHIKSYRIMRDSMENFRIQAFRNVLTHEEMLTSAIPPSIDWTFGLEYPLEDEDEENIARRLLDVLPLDHVVTLQVFGQLPYGEDLLVEKLGIFRH